MGTRSVPMEICVDTSPLRGRGVWGNEVSPQGYGVYEVLRMPP
jgi:hypothetical protein